MLVTTADAGFQALCLVPLLFAAGVVNRGLALRVFRAAHPARTHFVLDRLGGLAWFVAAAERAGAAILVSRRSSRFLASVTASICASIWRVYVERLGRSAFLDGANARRWSPVFMESDADGVDGGGDGGDGGVFALSTPSVALILRTKWLDARASRAVMVLVFMAWSLRGLEIAEAALRPSWLFAVDSTDSLRSSPIRMTRDT